MKTGEMTFACHEEEVASSLITTARNAPGCPPPALAPHKDPGTGPYEAPKLRTLLPLGKEDRLKFELGLILPQERDRAALRSHSLPPGEQARRR